MLNGEARSSEMIYQALLVNEPIFVDIHPDWHWVKLLRLDLLEFKDLLVHLKLHRTVLLRVLSELKEEDWSRCVCEEGKQRSLSIGVHARLSCISWTIWEFWEKGSRKD